eukprot:TRINITY_DN17752_c0_g1_i1.p1 TRINITY_DN17752_c0_g1~~TRINITY_DN17752_c0_g1_i1.p1  ORF type:complete len:299 (-),score=37.19 TRINITY_DN17752_c0_g1_i1:356-1252(-)
MSHKEAAVADARPVREPQQRCNRRPFRRRLGRRLAWPSGAFLACCLSLLDRCQAETWDIQLQLYRDPVCMERVEDILLMDQGCYANLYSNITKAYSLKILFFNYPQSIEVREFSDNCQSIARPPRPMGTERCVRFLGGLWAVVRLLFRSPTCVGECSKLGVSEQVFYPEKNCGGRPIKSFWYPSPGCMRAANGTQELGLNTDSRGTNITFTDFIYNSACDGGIVKVYEVPSGSCFPLYEDRSPRSFQWVAYPAMITGIGSPAIGGAARLASGLGGVLARLLALATLSAGAALPSWKDR